MGMQPSSTVESLLSALGFVWPQTDEGAVRRLADVWLGLARDLPPGTAEAEANALRVWRENTSLGVDAFRSAWSEPTAAKANLDDGATAAALIGVGLLACAGIVLALKINYVVQLTLLAVQIAYAVAGAVVTGGASLALIPLFRAATSLIMNQLHTLALNAVVGG